jgi:hypothetical protein
LYIYKYNDYITLKQLANALQYKVVESDKSVIKYTSWIIEVKSDKEISSLWELAHEIGHGIQFKRKVKINKSDSHNSRGKTKVIAEELFAWVIGFVLCKLFQINTKGMVKHSLKCLKTYL